MSREETNTKTESSKCLTVVVVAKPPEKTKHLGDASEPGSWSGPTSDGDTFYLPMVVFGYKAELKIPFELLKKSGYMRNQLKGPWKNQSVVEIPLKNPRGVNAFAQACMAGLSSNPEYETIVNGFNQFNLYSAASMLQLNDLQEFCESYIGKHLTTERFLAAMKHGIRYKRSNMLVQCYRWFKVNGAVAKEVAKEEEAEEMATDKALASAAGMVAPKRLKYDAETQTVFTDTRKADISVFEPLIIEEHKKKTRYFIPPDDVPIVEENEEEKTSSDNNILVDNVKKAMNAKGFPGLTRCYVKRKHEMGENKDETHYIVHDEKTQQVILAASCKDGKSFILSKDENVFEIGSDSYLGIVKPNFTGTTFKCLDYGIDPSLFPGDGLAHSKAVEHASIVYVTNVLGRVPNAMTVVIPKINFTQSELSEEERASSTDDDKHKTHDAENTENSPDYVPAHHKASRTEKLAKYYNKEDDRVIILKTRKPIWSDEADAWTMDFNGRVKLASKKNFQLVDINSDKEKTLMNFGKVTKEHFSLDYCKPMTLIQCFAVALTSFSDKMMVT